MSEHTVPYKAGWAWALDRLMNDVYALETLQQFVQGEAEGMDWEKREFAKGALAACKHYREITK